MEDMLLLKGTPKEGKSQKKSSHDDGSKPSCDDGKKVDEDPRKENKCKDQEKEDNVNRTNNVNTHIQLSSDDEDDGTVADMNNLDTTIQVSLIPTTRIHQDHHLDQMIRILQLATQTRKMSMNLEEHRAIGTNWVFKNKKDERGIVIRNKARLVTQGYTQEERIDYNEVFAPVVRIEAISAFLYGKIEEKVCVCHPPGFEDPDILDRVYKVEKHYMDYIRLLELVKCDILERYDIDLAAFTVVFE
nr:putative ribonuclease H-like domain-containing protein [Tanacetum cinerariifolium]